MAAPMPVTRTTPPGQFLQNGFPAHIACSIVPGMDLWEKSVKPPAIDGGDAIDISTMFNTLSHTMAPRKLIKWDDVTADVAYEVGSYAQILRMVNVPSTWTVSWPDTGSVTFFGFLRKVEFKDLKDGEQPEATITVCISNWDYVNHVEADPIITIVTGT